MLCLLTLLVTLAAPQIAVDDSDYPELWSGFAGPQPEEPVAVPPPIAPDTWLVLPPWSRSPRTKCAWRACSAPRLYVNGRPFYGDPGGRCAGSGRAELRELRGCYSILPAPDARGLGPYIGGMKAGHE